MPFFTGYLAQGTGGATAFVENSSTGYARVPVTIGSLSGGQSSLATTVTLYGSASVTVTQRALYDAATGGNLIMWWNLKTVKVLTNSLPDTINKGALMHTFPALYGPQGLGATPVSLAAASQIGITSDGNPLYSGVASQVSYGTIQATTTPSVSLSGPGGSSSSSSTGGLVAVTPIAASGSSQTLTFQGTQTNYDITLSANCALSVTTTGATAGQNITAILRGPFSWTPPANAAYANSSAPVFQCSAKLYDAIQFTLLADGTLLGSVISLGTGLSTLAVTAFAGITYSTGTVTVSGTYAGAAPTNLDYSVDGASFTTLTTGAATITNGTFSFTLPSTPAVGSHTVAVRATGTSEVSPSQNLTISTPASPSAVVLAASPGASLVTLTMSATPNGSAVTSFTVYRGTAAGGESGTALGTATASGNAATYTDSTAVNGTRYYYTATATNSVGTSSASNEASATPSTSVSSHYYNGTNSTTSTTPGKAEGITDGYLDVQAFVSLASLAAAENFIGRWGNATNADSEFLFLLNANGTLELATRVGSNSFAGPASTAALSTSSNAAINTFFWVRAQVNMGAATVNGITSGSFVYSTSPDGTTWTQLGTTIGGFGTSGLNQLSASVTAVSVGSSSTIKVGKVIVNKSSGVLYNPDYTAQTTGATSFVDGAGNTWTTTAGAQT